MSKLWYMRDMFFHYPNKVYKVKGDLSSQVEYLQTIDNSNPAYISKQYKTKPKMIVRDLISDASNRLIGNKYAGTRGENSTLLLGAKGIGKSSTLISSCIALSTMYDNLIPIYLQYTHKNTPLPSTAIIKNLEERDILTSKSKDAVNKDVRELTEFLSAKGLRVLLVVDEMDQLYESKDDETRRLSVLDDISYFASDPSGCYCTIGCGSSSYLPLLITKNGIGNKYVEKKYPLLPNAPNLNGSKFPSFRLGVGIMQDDEYEEILEDKTGTKPSKGDINFYRFFAGPNIRRIGQIATGLGRKTNLEQIILPYDATDSRTIDVMDDMGYLINATYNKLVSKNFDLIKQINRDTGVDELLRLDWSLIEPLNEDDIATVIRKEKEKGHNCDRKDYFRLIDANWFLGNENLTEIYPQIPFHLVCHKLEVKPREMIVYAKKIVAEVYRLTPNIIRSVIKI